MTIRKTTGGEHVCECDECGDSQYAGTLDFMEFVRHLKAEGWLARRDGPASAWENVCPECRDEEEEEG